MEKSEEHTAMTTRKSPPTRNQIILLIDDNADLLGLTKMVLEVNDYEVFTALSAAEALN